MHVCNNRHLKTELQLWKLGKVVKPNEAGETLWTNQNCKVKAVYYRPDQTVDDEKQAAALLKAHNAELRALRKKRKREMEAIERQNAFD